MYRRLAAAAAAVLTAFAVLALSAPSVSAAGPKSYQWTGAVSTAWGNASNWAGNEVPEENSIVQITSGSNKTVTGIPAITLLNFTLGPDMALQSGGPITAAEVVLNGGTIAVSITADLVMTLQQTDSEKPIRVSGDGDTQLTSNLEMLSYGGTTLELWFDGDLINNGTWTLMPGIISQRTVVAVNRCCSSATSIIDNNGTINQVGDDSTLRVSNGFFLGRPGSKVMAPIEIVGGEPRFGGLVKVIGPTGALRLSDNAVLRQLLTAAPTIELRNGGGFSQASGAAIAAPVTFTKTGTGVADYDWYAGDITGAVTIGENVNLRLRDNTTRGFRPPVSTDTLTIRGRMAFHGNATLQITGRIVNTGTIAANQGKAGQIFGMSCCTDPYRVVNSGLMSATASGSSLTVANASLMSVGPDSTLRGTIIIDGGINSLGNGATLKGETTRVSVINRGVVRGEGTLTVELGARLFWSGFSTIRGASDFTVDGKGRVVWNSGSLIGRLTTSSDTTLELVDLSSEIDPYRTIDTDGRDSILLTKGDVVQRADLRLNGSTFDAVVRNQGRWTLKKGGVLRWGASSLRNEGRLVVDGLTDSTVTRWNADRVVIAGDVDVDKGDLFVEPTMSFRQTGGAVTVAKDSVLFVDDQYRLDGGRLGGNGVVETSTLVNKATVEPSPGKAKLRLLGDYRQTERGRLSVELGPTSASWLSVSGNAYLAGTVRVTTTGSLPVRGTGSVILEARDRIGIFDELVGPNAARLRFAPTNDSVILVTR